MSITLVTEGLVLWLFGYRTKRTWIIFLAEAIAFALLFREKGKPRAALAALCANSVSLAAGVFLLTNLPL